MKRFFTLISYFVGITFILALILFLSEREHLKERTVKYLSFQIKQHTGWEIEFEKVDLVLPLTLKADKIVISKELEPVLIAKNISFSIDPWELISHRIAIDTAYIEELSLCGKCENGLSQDRQLKSEISKEESLLIGLKIKQFTIEKFSITPELINYYHWEEISQLKTPIQLRLNGNINPFEQQFYAEVAITQNGSPEILGIISIKKELADWLAQIRVKIPAGSLLSPNIPFSDIFSYNLISQLNLSPSFEVQKGDLQVVYESEDLHDEIFGNYGSLQTAFTLDKGNIEFSQFNGLLGPFILEGNGRYSLDKGSIDLQCSSIQSDDILARKFLDTQIKKGKANFSLSGTFKNLQGNIHLKADQCLYQQELFEEVSADCLFSLEIGIQPKFSGKIDLRGRHQHSPLSISTTVIAEKEKINFQDLHLNYGLNKAFGNFYLIVEDSLLQGQLEGELEADFISSLIDSEITPEVEGRITFISHFYLSDAQSNVQIVDLSLQSPLLQVDKCLFRKLALNIKGFDPIKKSLGTLTASCQEIRVNEWNAADLMFSTHADTSLDHSPFLLTCKDKVNGKMELFSKGFWSYHSGSFKLNLDAFEGQMAQYGYKLQDHAVLELLEEKFVVSPLYFKINEMKGAVTVQEGSLFATCENSQNELKAIIRAQNLPLGLVHVFDPAFPIDGSFGFETELSDGAHGVQGNITAVMKGLHLKEEKLNDPLPIDLHFKAQFQDEKLSCSGRVVGLGPHPFDLEATLPIALGLKPFKFQLLTDRPVSLHAAMQGKIESFLELFMPATTTTITGNLAVDLNMSGTLDSPQFVGKGDLTQFTYEVSDLGIVLNRGHAHLDIFDKQLTISNLEAFSLNGGVLTGSGKAELVSENFPFDLQFQLKKIPLAPQEYATTTVSGRLAFKGNKEKALLEGKLVTDALKIVIPEEIPELVHSVAITYINQPNHLPAPTTYKPHNSNWPLFLNVELDIPSQGYISGKGWESEWKGHVVFNGTSDAPLLHGSATIKRGEYDFNGKAFQFTQGTLTFNGDLEKKTSIYIIASRDLDTIRAEVIVKGLTKNPSITFRSNPPLPQREILSWILFNRGTSEISTFQGSQLNKSITNLSTKGSSQPDMLTKFREKIGIDRLDINREGGAANEVSVQVGKYISRGILVSVNRSITAETNRIAIEAALMKHVKVQAEVGDDSDAQLLLKWKKDY